MCSIVAFYLFLASEVHLAEPGAAYQKALSALHCFYLCNEPPSAVLSFYDKDINNSALYLCATLLRGVLKKVRVSRNLIRSFKESH